jgi:hypothetical protein
VRRCQLRFPGAWLALATISVAAVLSGCLIQYHPQLTRGLSGPWDVVSARFDARVREALPEGLDEAEAARRLRKQGFSNSKIDSVALPGEVAWSRSESTFVCNIAARIYWRPDAQGRISGVHGLYREEGCL